MAKGGNWQQKKRHSRENRNIGPSHCRASTCPSSSFIISLDGSSGNVEVKTEEETLILQILF